MKIEQEKGTERRTGTEQKIGSGETNFKMDHRELIQKQANVLDYDLVGFSNLMLDEEDRKHLTEFYLDNSTTDMAWFGRHLQLRLFPSQILPQAKGAIVLGLYYRDQKSETSMEQARVRVARYAHGRDYHRVLHKKGKKLIRLLQTEIPWLEARVCVDSAPVPEKILGRMAGLGWQGKNTNLIHPKLGSYFFLSVILVNLGFPTTKTVSDQCRDCRLCVDACPTHALADSPPYRINAQKCISYLTIEHKGTIDKELQPAISRSNWAFGCDICQEVCPYNRNPKTRELSSHEPGFNLSTREGGIEQLMLTAKLPPQSDWEQWSKGSPLRRVSYEKLQENIALASTNQSKDKEV